MTDLKLWEKLRVSAGLRLEKLQHAGQQLLLWRPGGEHGVEQQ